MIRLTVPIFTNSKLNMGSTHGNKKIVAMWFNCEEET